MRSIVKLFTIMIAMLLSASAPASPARAEEGPPPGLSLEGLRIQSMSVSVRPEYDRSGVLVIYDALVVNESPKPYSGELAFQIPEGAPVPHACEITREGQHLSRLPRTESVGSWRVVRWKLDRELGPGDVYHAFVEFYYDPIEKADGFKRFAYQFVPLVPADRVEVSVVEPLRATDFRLSPQQAASRAVPLDGTTFNTHLLQFDSLRPGQPVRIDVSYRKPDDRPSIAPEAGSTAPGGAGDRPPGAARGRVDPALAGVAVVLIGALGFFLYQGVRRSATALRSGATPAIRRRPASRPDAPQPPAARGAAGHLSADDERRLARQLLLKGRISEATYQQILKDLEREARPE